MRIKFARNKTRPDAGWSFEVNLKGGILYYDWMILCDFLELCLTAEDYPT